MTSHHDIERPLPHSPFAEQRLLGAILVGNQEARAVLDRLSPNDFFLPPNQRIFRVAQKLSQANIPVDLLSVHEALLQADPADAAHLVAYLAQLGDEVPRAESLDFYARTIKSKSTRRALIHTAYQVYQNAFDAPESEEVLLDRSIESFSDLARNLEGDRDSGSTYRQAASALLREFDDGEGVRIFTDVDELDRLTGGFRAGELVILTAETGVGKTLFAQQTRQRACRDGRHTLFCSGEMLAHHLVAREIATKAGVEHWKMRRPERITPNETSALIEAACHECERCRILDGELSMARIRRVARQMKSQTGLDSVIVDYDELLEAPGQTEFEQQRYIARAAKSLAMELKLPVFLISQLRKSLQGEDRSKPTLQRLYGGLAKAKHSSFVIYINRPYVQDLCGDETEAQVLVLKSRDGKLGALKARFNVKTLRFESVPRNDSE
jgi:replicative DNA helicase